MKFTLTFDGELPSTGNSSKKKQVKWELRKQFHPQLAELVRTHPVLKEAFNNGVWIPKGEMEFHVSGTHHSFKSPAPGSGWQHEVDGWNLCDQREVGGKTFWPVVRESLALTCNLDILFLRKEEPGSLVLQGGDLDNRIKTLFDALRLPSQDEIVDDSSMEGPTLCLLESDTLVTGLKLRSDRLLNKPNSSVHEVQLVIEVDIRVSQTGLYNLAFLGD
jgi:hypothetical protein